MPSKILGLALLFCSLKSFGLIDLSFKGGGTITQHKIKFSDGMVAGGASKGVGYLLGLGLDLGGQGFGLESDIFYTMRSSVPISLAGYGFDYKMKAIEIPLTLRFRFLYIQMGGGFYYSTSLGKIKIDSGYRLKKSEYGYDELGLKAYDYGLVGTLSGLFPTETLGAVLMELRWNQGLSNRAKSPIGESRFDNYSYDLLVGFTF